MCYKYVYFICANICHSVIPVDTDTFKECLVPACGISIHASHLLTISGSTPSTSLPAMIAYFLPS